MISWLKGEKIETWHNGNRLGVLISCAGIGYEVQLLAREIDLLKAIETELVLWVHQIQKDDGSQLIGFLEKLDRDLFRKLISISGVGPQLAISLLDQNKAKPLIQAINNQEVAQLTSCPGIGKRTAERIIIELKNKLSGLMPEIKVDQVKCELAHKEETNSTIKNEVKSALINLGYKNMEIDNAFEELRERAKLEGSDNKHNKSLLHNAGFTELFKEILLRINKQTR